MAQLYLSLAITLYSLLALSVGLQLLNDQSVPSVAAHTKPHTHSHTRVHAHCIHTHVPLPLPPSSTDLEMLLPSEKKRRVNWCTWYKCKKYV